MVPPLTFRPSFKFVDRGGNTDVCQVFVYVICQTITKRDRLPVTPTCGRSLSQREKDQSSPGAQRLCSPGREPVACQLWFVSTSVSPLLPRHRGVLNIPVGSRQYLLPFSGLGLQENVNSTDVLCIVQCFGMHVKTSALSLSLSGSVSLSLSGSVSLSLSGSVSLSLSGSVSLSLSGSVSLSLSEGSHRLPLHRCHHDPAAAGGLDPPPGAARRGLLPDQRRPLDQLGGGDEGEEEEGQKVRRRRRG